MKKYHICFNFQRSEFNTVRNICPLGRKPSIQALEQKVRLLENELAKEKARVFSVVNGLAFPAWLKDSEGKFICVSQAYKEVHVKKGTNVTGKTDYDLYPEGEAKIWVRDDREVIRKGSVITFQNKKNDKWYITNKCPVFDEKGKIAGIFGYERDTTEYLEAIELLATERDFLEELMNHLPYNIYFKDTQSRFTRINNAQADFLGISHPGKALGKTDFDFLPRERAEEAFREEQKIVKTGEPLIERQEKHIMPGGEEKWMAATKIAVRDKKGNITGMVGISRDITREREAAFELKEAKAKAEEADRLKSTFLANMSHEIRSPMNGIIGFARLIRDLDPDRQTILKYVSLILNCGNNLLALIDDIIDISKIEANQLKIRKTGMDVVQTMQEIEESYRNTKKDRLKKMEFSLNIPDDVSDFHIITDPLRFNQIMNNLLSNAFKFTKKGRIEFGFTKPENGMVEFFVHDTGIGIPEEKEEIIFERFGQIAGSNTEEGGTGLGLAITKNLVELLGGTIRVDSVENEGSSFYFRLPWVPAEKNGETVAPGIKKKKEKYRWPGKKILVVEDELFNYYFLEEIISVTGARVIRAVNGKEALEKIRNRKDIDLVLMDIRLPEMDGYEVTRQIRELDPDIPVIAQTAGAMPGEREKCLEAGCNEYISKPLDVEVLMSLIDRYVGERDH